MDSQTVAIYDSIAERWAQKYNRLRSKLVQKLAIEYFHPGKKTLEIGCGSGRDLNFLNDRGFPITGLDASEGLLTECRKHSPDYQYILDSLPSLKKVETGHFFNGYSSAVLMHLNREDIAQSFENIARILRDGGVFVFSYRHSLEEKEREGDGRLFTFIDPDWLSPLMEGKGFQILSFVAERLLRLRR